MVPHFSPNDIIMVNGPIKHVESADDYESIIMYIHIEKL